MSILIALFFACSSNQPCSACAGDAMCVQQVRTDGTEVAECRDIPPSCAPAFVEGSCADEMAVSNTCRADAGAFCPSVLPDHSDFGCVVDGGRDYLSVVCENR